MKLFKSKLFIALAVLLGIVVVANVILYEPDIPLEELKAKYTNAQSKFIEVDGLQVYYRIEGEGEPFVLVHGTGSVLQSWDGWAQLLSPHFKIIRMDIPAFGLTGPRADADYSDEMYVEFLNHFVSKLGIDSFHLAGNSLGGLIAWRYAATYPGKVKKLVLVDPGGFYDVNRKGGSLVFKLARNYPGITGVFSKIGTKYLVKKTLSEVYYDDSKITDQWSEMYTDLNRREGNRQAFLDRAKHIHQHTEDQLATIAAPTLVMWGREDVLIDVAMAEHFKKIANSTEVIYDKVGHSPQEEIPERSAADVMRFLKKETLSAKERYDTLGYTTPVQLIADFNRDDTDDTAMLIKNERTSERGILIRHGRTQKEFVFGAGNKFDNGGKDFNWLKSWNIYTNKEVYLTLFDTTTLDIIGKEEQPILPPALEVVDESNSGGGFIGMVTAIFGYTQASNFTLP